MNKEYMPLTVAVFLVAVGLFFGFLFLPQNGTTEGRTGLDSTAIIPSAQGAEVNDNAALNVQGASFFAAAARGSSGDNTGETDPSYGSGEGMVQDDGAAVGISENRSSVINYVVKKGDTLSSIASYFGISAETILAANPGMPSGGVNAREVIKILPTSGVLYEAQAGDTLASIANIFNTCEDDLLRYNPSVDFSSITPGTFIVIPNDGAALAALAAAAGTAL